MSHTNDIRERAERIARQFTAQQLLQVAALFVERADNELEDARPDMDFTVELGAIRDQLDVLAEQAGEAFVPSMSRDDWAPTRSFAQLGLVRRVG